MNIEKMKTLDRYKKLSDEDKYNMALYCIYNYIYDAAKNEEFDICDEDVINISKFSYELYLDNEVRKLSAPDIAYFLTNCYMKDSSFLNKMRNMNYDDILQAVEDDNYDFYKEERER